MKIIIKNSRNMPFMIVDISSPDLKKNIGQVVYAIERPTTRQALINYRRHGENEDLKVAARELERLLVLEEGAVEITPSTHVIEVEDI